jgi:hypothetical protein
MFWSHILRFNLYYTVMIPDWRLGVVRGGGGPRSNPELLRGSLVSANGLNPWVTKSPRNVNNCFFKVSTSPKIIPHENLVTLSVWLWTGTQRTTRRGWWCETAEPRSRTAAHQAGTMLNSVAEPHHFHPTRGRENNSIAAPAPIPFRLSY